MTRLAAGKGIEGTKAIEIAHQIVGELFEEQKEEKKSDFDMFFDQPVLEEEEEEEPEVIVKFKLFETEWEDPEVKQSYKY